MKIIGAKAQLPARSETKQTPLAAPLTDELALAFQFARAEKSPATRRAYRSDFYLFRNWCQVRKLESLPADPVTLATFLASEAKRGIKPSSLERRLAGIRYAHLLAGHRSPLQAEAVKATFRGIRRTFGAAPNRKEPLTADLVRALVRHAPSTLIGLRDRALLLLGFAGAFRRSELVGLDVADLKENSSGLQVRIRSSKTDQERFGQVIGIARGKSVCPVKAVRAWLKAADIRRGPVFRSISKGGRVSVKRLSGHAVAEIVKTCAKQAGIDPAAVSAHSLRSGFLTSAAQRGASVFRLMDISRHKSVDTLSGYVQSAGLFSDHPGADLL